MNKWMRRAAFLLVAIAPGCDDLSPEPEGPLLITRLTLLDAAGRDVPVFTDTSAPLDCAQAGAKDSERCVGDPFKDRFGARRSPPTPDSGQDIRVVLNKLPLRIGDRDIEIIKKGPNGLPIEFQLTDPTTLTLACEPAAGCTQAPPALAAATLGGSQQSPDPTTFPYGPGLQLVVTADDDHSLAALEPATGYRVVPSPQIGDRLGNKIQLDAAALALLSFTTEPFRVLRVGAGDDDQDPWVHGDAAAGTAAAPYEVADLPQDGVLVLRLNAAMDDTVLKVDSVRGTALGKEVMLKLSIHQLRDQDGKQRCDPGDHRALYLFPAGGSFGDLPAGTEVAVVLRGADVRDISQAAGHPAGAGRHALPVDVHLRATLTGQAADDKYTGLVVAQVRAAADCPK